MIVRPSREGVAKVNPPDRDLRDRIEELEEENRQLREQLAPVLPRNPKIKLMKSHWRVLDLLIAKSPKIATKHTIYVTCFGEDCSESNINVAIRQIFLLLLVPLTTTYCYRICPGDQPASIVVTKDSQDGDAAQSVQRPVVGSEVNCGHSDHRV